MDWSINNKVVIALDSVVYIWDATHGTIDTVGKRQEIGNVCSLKWSSDGCYLGIGTKSGETQIWDTKKNKKLRTIKVEEDNSTKVDIKSQTKSSHKSDLTTSESNSKQYVKSRVGCISWNKNILTSAFSNGMICHNDVRVKDSLIQSIRAHEDSICGLKWRSDGKYLASGGNDNLIKLWELKSSKPYMEKSDHNSAIKVKFFIN